MSEQAVAQGEARSHVTDEAIDKVQATAQAQPAAQVDKVRAVAQNSDSGNASGPGVGGTSADGATAPVRSVRGRVAASDGKSAQETAQASSGECDRGNPAAGDGSRSPAGARESLRIVAIDGPAGAGKSTIAARLAERFQLLNLETGAMYRAFALKALRAGVDPDDAFGLEALSRTSSITLEPGESGNRVLLDGVEVTAELRDPEVTQTASRVSVHPAIRSWMVGLQRELGAGGNVVMEGRDIGTAVFPEADVKVFLDASPEARSQRRYQQDDTHARPAAAVLDEMRERDERDRNRAQSPLRPAADAVVIDSTDLTLDQVTEQVTALITARWTRADRC